jgi:hypothetical protein
VTPKPRTILAAAAFLSLALIAGCASPAAAPAPLPQPTAPLLAQSCPSADHGLVADEPEEGAVYAVTGGFRGEATTVRPVIARAYPLAAAPARQRSLAVVDRR